jgi:biopolymer transport protein ExbD
MEYLLKSVLCLLLLLLFHRLVLQQEVLYRFNRFFLLAVVIGSFLIPLVSFEVEQEVVIAPIPTEVFAEEISSAEHFQDVTEMPVLEEENSEKTEVQIPWVKVGWTVYLIGVVVFLIRFLRNLRSIYQQVQGNHQVTYRQETLVLLPEMVSPFSFLKYIFFSKSSFEKAGMPEAVFLHEQCHVHQKHTWDVLLVEALLVVFWFHPGLYLARQAIRLNHEFIADQQVIQQLPVSEYQSLLLAILSGQQGFALGSSLNFSLTKKRFEMMNRKVNKPSTWMKMLSVVPILAGLIYLFSDKIPAQSEGEKKRKVSLEMGNSPKEKLETHILIKSDGQLEVDGQLVKLEDLEGLIESKYTTHDLAVISGESGVEMGQLADVHEALRNQNVRQVVYQNSQATSQEVTLEEKMERHFREAIFLIESTDMEYTQKRYGELSEKEKSWLLFTDKKVEKENPDNQLFEQWKNEKEFAIWIDGKSVANMVLSKYQAKDFVKWFQSGVKANARTARFPQPFQVNLYSPKYFEESFGPNSDMFRPRTNRDTITITQRKMTSMKDLSRYPDPVTAFLQKNARYEKLKASPNAGEPEVKQEIKRLFEELESDYAKTPDNRKHRLKKPIAPNAADAGKSVSVIPQNKSTYWNLYSKYETKVNRNGLFGKVSQEEIAQLEKDFKMLDLTFARLSLEDKMQVKRPSFPFARLTQEGKVIYKKLEDLTEEEKKSMVC